MGGYLNKTKPYLKDITVKPLTNTHPKYWTPPNNGQKLEDSTKLVQMHYKKAFKWRTEIADTSH